MIGANSKFGEEEQMDYGLPFLLHSKNGFFEVEFP